MWAIGLKLLRHEFVSQV